MDLVTILLFALGLVALVGGAELLVRGASRLAATLGVSPLVIGLTVVAYGTSAPEMAVSVAAAWKGHADMAIGNVVGSNIFNVLFILGISALITPVIVAQELVRRDVPIMIGLSIAVALMALDGVIGWIDGVVLLAGLTIYTVWCVRSSRTKVGEHAEEFAVEYGHPKPSGWLVNVVLVLAGLALLVVGSRWLVEGAVAFAHWCGISEIVVSLTIVAAGTSLPEVATSVLAAIRGERDIAVGNVVGSNIFNIMGVLGMSATVAPSGLTIADSMLAFDVPVMIAVAVACLPIFVTGHRIARWEAVLFLAYYFAYTAYVVMAATHHDALGGFAWIMGSFVLPLTAATLAVVSWRAWRLRSKSARSPAAPGLRVGLPGPDQK